MQAKLDELDAFLGMDFGKQLEFHKFHKQCFSTQIKQYTYEICPFEEAKQKEGSSGTSLGRWAGFGVSAAGVPTMSFTGGQGCWQGPQRSLTVDMSCGLQNEVGVVDEPSKCVYVMQFKTPAVCHENHLQALQMQLLDQQNKMMAGDDDEAEAHSM